MDDQSRVEAGITAYTHAASPAEALRLLWEGNRRFTTGRRLLPHQDADYRTALAKAQRPSPSSSAAPTLPPAEIIFDQGLGDLFVVRTAGHGRRRGVGQHRVRGGGPEDPLVAVLGHDSVRRGRPLTAVRGQGTGRFHPGGRGAGMLSALTVPEPQRADPRAIVEEHIRYTTEMLVRAQR